MCCCFWKCSCAQGVILRCLSIKGDFNYLKSKMQFLSWQQWSLTATNKRVESVYLSPWEISASRECSLICRRELWKTRFAWRFACKACHVLYQVVIPDINRRILAPTANERKLRLAKPPTNSWSNQQWQNLRWVTASIIQSVYLSSVRFIQFLHTSGAVSRYFGGRRFFQATEKYTRR